MQQNVSQTQAALLNVLNESLDRIRLMSGATVIAEKLIARLEAENGELRSANVTLKEKLELPVMDVAPD